MLEPKSDLRSRNLPSPDRADAVLGAMTGLMSLSLGCFTAADLAAMPDPDPALLAEHQLFAADRLKPEDF